MTDRENEKLNSSFIATKIIQEFKTDLTYKVLLSSNN